MQINPCAPLRGEITVPGDKSISHRAVMLGALASGTTHITGFLMGEDCLSTIDCFRKMGVSIDVSDKEVVVEGVGLHGLTAPKSELYTGNSGTTTRLLSGILAGQSFTSTMNGDASIQKRPMGRVMKPLREMGASIEGRDDNFCPLTMHPSELHGIEYRLPVASAQLKSAILLAGLYAEGQTTVIEPAPSRDHTERMFRALGVEIETDVIVGRTVTVDSLLGEEGFDAVFIGSGAGLPRFMGIGGENLNGVVSANEFLTRANLMHAYDKAYDTPIYVGQRVVVVGGGNVAMDAVRTAKRLGAEATIVYRRSEAELPARAEEVHHAKEEGIVFRMLANPVEVLGDEQGWVRGLRCVEMTLGEPDESGRRRPVEKEGSEFDVPCDVVIMALGTSPNPLLAATTSGLETDRRGCLTADAEGRTTRAGVFAGGDAVTGAATVILAMGAGRRAARAIDEYIRTR